MGWAAGFQAGSRAAKDALDTYYATKERLDLEKAMGLTPQEVQARQATPDEISRAQAETQGLAAQDAAMFGNTAPGEAPFNPAMYAPTMPQAGQRVGLSTYQIGNQTFNRQPTQAEIDAARYTAAADVVALRNPLEAQRMRLAAAQEQRAVAAEGRAVTAEDRAQQGFLTEQQLRKYQLGEAEEKAAVTGRSKQFSEWYSQNPNATFADISAKTKELKMTTSERFKVASDITGINVTELKNNSAMLEKLTQGKGYQELLQIHKDSELLDPGSHFEAIPGKNGQISLQRVDTKTGKAIGGVAFTGSEAEVTKYLSTAANAPDTIVDFTLNLETKRASIAKDLAAADNYRADAKLRQAKANEDKAAKVMDASTVEKLNKLSMEISDADARGDTKKATDLFNQWTREYAIGATQMGKIVQPKQPGLAKSLTPHQDDRYKDLLKNPKWDRAKTTAEKVALLRAEGIPPEAVGFGGRQDVYAGDRSSESQGLTPTPPAAPAPAPAPAAAPTGLRTGGERNPYVDVRGRPIANPPPAGDAAPITQLVPALQSAGRSVAAGLDTAAVRYLADKMRRNEPLSAAEQLRAASMGFYD